MKKNLPVSQQEKTYDEQHRIISSTDLKGLTTHANKTFIELSGFTEDELIGKNHNVIRHPDMPTAVFQMLWDKLKAGQSWKGVLKNRCKNGDHYWVDAFVVPVKENNKIVGYESVRHKPQKDDIRRAEQAYTRINAGKSPIPHTNKLAALPWALISTLTLGTAAVGLATYANPFIALIPIAATALVTRWQGRSLSRILHQARKINHDPLATYVFTGRTDTVGEVLFAFQHLDNQLTTLRERVLDTMPDIKKSSQASHTAATDSMKKLKEQLEAANLFANAFEEITAQTDTISESVNQTAEQTSSAKHDTRICEQQMLSAKNSLEEMAKTLSTASDHVQHLAENADSIQSFLETIQSIAEQTNLLALNAAIEAARAGEQGRGFAVVADEVRSLASRTQESTEEIRRIIEELQQGASQATSTMDISRKQVDDNGAQVQTTYDTLTHITQSVAEINRQMSAIKHAASEQKDGASQVSIHMATIRQNAQANSESAKASQSAAQQVTNLVNEQLAIIERFK